MILIANGCSHTAGAEIEEPLQGECYDKAWPKKLADSLAFKHVNLAISGASDDRVVRTTLEYISKLKKSHKFNPRKIFVAINWPGLHRTELYQTSDEEPGFWDDGWMPMVIGNEETYKTQCSQSAFAFYKTWVIRQNNHQATIKFYSNILLLQNLLIANNIKYLFWNSSMTVPDNFPHYLNEINHKRFPHILEKEKCFTEMLELNGFKHSLFAKWGHYGEDAQEWFADFLKTYITKNKLL
ncbi:hypothetical protein OAV13_00490 [bacterium]|nr:hypothetical protein [bacterium]